MTKFSNLYKQEFNIHSLFAAKVLLKSLGYFYVVRLVLSSPSWDRGKKLPLKAGGCLTWSNLLELTKYCPLKVRQLSNRVDCYLMFELLNSLLLWVFQVILQRFAGYSVQNNNIKVHKKSKTIPFTMVLLERWNNKKVHEAYYTFRTVFPNGYPEIQKFGVHDADFPIINLLDD